MQTKLDKTPLTLLLVKLGCIDMGSQMTILIWGTLYKGIKPILHAKPKEKYFATNKIATAAVKKQNLLMRSLRMGILTNLFLKTKTYYRGEKIPYLVEAFFVGEDKFGIAISRRQQ